MNIYSDDQLFPFIIGDMLGSSGAVRVVRGARPEEVSDPRTGGKVKKLALHFHGTGKRLILNKTNVKRLIKLYGPDTDNWRDKPVELYAEEVKAFGAVHNTVRIGESKPATPTDVAKMLEPVTDDEALEVLG